MKILTPQKIEEYFLKLLINNKKTTTREVKDALRNDGFYALELVVSNAIKSLYKKCGAKRNFNGQYFVYELENAELLDKNDLNIIEKYKIKDILSDDSENIITVTISNNNGGLFNVIVSFDEPIDYDYKILYNKSCIAYIYSTVNLSRSQYKYYAYVALKEKFNIDKYFDINCRKNKIK